MAFIESGTPDLLTELDEGVAVLTMNRPDRRNALSVEMIDALAAALAAAEDDDRVGAVVLTGAGRAFCAGGDVKDFADRPPGPASAGQLVRQRRSQAATSGRLCTMAKPTVALVPGAAAGAGLSLALACDLRYAADTAVLTTAFARVGLSGDYGSAWLLTRLVGPAKARELLYLSARLTAQQAADLGLVNKVLPAAELQDAAMAIARSLAAGPRSALAAMKANVDLALSATLADYMDIEVSRHLEAFGTADHAEAAQAFVAKREPVFGRG